MIPSCKKATAFYYTVNWVEYHYQLVEAHENSDMKQILDLEITYMPILIIS